SPARLSAVASPMSDLRDVAKRRARCRGRGSPRRTVERSTNRPCPPPARSGPLAKSDLWRNDTPRFWFRGRPAWTRSREPNGADARLYRYRIRSGPPVVCWRMEFRCCCRKPGGTTDARRARDCLRRPLECRQVFARQRADWPAHLGPYFKHAGPHATIELLRWSVPTHARRHARLWLCRGGQKQRGGMVAAGTRVFA